MIIIFFQNIKVKFMKKIKMITVLVSFVLSEFD